MTKCPETQQDVPTGYRTSDRAFNAQSQDLAFRCPVCSQIHRWREPDSWVDGEQEGGRLHAS